MFGIIPFSYKERDIKKFNIPEFLYVKNPEDLKNKIEYLENNKPEYLNIWDTLQNLISKGDLWDGSRFFSNVERYVKKDLGYSMNRTGKITYKSSSIFVREELNNLENFMEGWLKAGKIWGHYKKAYESSQINTLEEFMQWKR